MDRGCHHSLKIVYKTNLTLIYKMQRYRFVPLCLWILSLKALDCEAFGPVGSIQASGPGDPSGSGVNQAMFIALESDEDERYHLKVKIDSTSDITKLRGGNKQGSSSIVTAFSEFWNRTFQKAASNVRKVFQSRQQKEDNKFMEELKSIPIKNVAMPTDTILPPEVVRLAVKRSGIVGQPLRPERIQEFARTLKRWYVRNGYVLHSVTGANLVPETGTAEIKLEEPKLAAAPVNITFCKEMIVDDDGSLVTFRQYVEKHSERRSFRHDRIDKKKLNTTYTITTGRTQPTKIARAMDFQPGGPFRWQGQRWNKISTSGIFSKILNVSPRRLQNGNVQLEVLATEPPPRHLEYGIGKSLYSGGWEGEIEFEHRNLLGGGENIGVAICRGTKDPEPSVRVKYSDNGLKLEGGYDVEVFSDYLGAPEISGTNTTKSTEHSFRKGMTFRLRNPISTDVIRNSVSSTSFENAFSKSGESEKIGSSTLTVGPFRRMLPLQTRSSIVSSVTGGARLATSNEGANSVTPYTSGSVTLTQVIPITIGSPKATSPVLALQHTFASSSKGLPHHEAKAMGVSAQIRGCSPWNAVSSSIRGSTELRLPVVTTRVRDSALVLFADWSCVQNQHASPLQRKSSIGLGLRKSVQGLPLKYDVCLTHDMKVKTMFGLGVDFDA